MVKKWETLFLLVMTLPIMGHVVILPLMLDVVGRDIWISVLLSLPAAFLIAWFIYRIRLLTPNETFPQLVKGILGKFGGSMVITICTMYFLFLTVLSAAALVDLVFIGFLPDTPRFVLLLWFILFAMYAASKGIKRIALTSSILAFITAITGHTVTLMDHPKKEWAYLQPILEFGWGPVLWGTLILISVWVELLFLLIIPFKDIKAKRIFLIWSLGIIINALMMLSTSTSAITIFGLGQAENLVYPAFSIVRIVDLGFIDRFDVYAVILMTFGVYIRCSLYLRIAHELTVESFQKKWKKYFVFMAYTAIVFIGSYYMVLNYYRLEGMIQAYAYSFILLPLVFLLYVIGRRRRKKEALSFPSSTTETHR
ncbi:GerAB/ArcD/ProY family transporter [Alteribacillus iranensis]|uniref:Spore germination protein (Amino acid permease) n=1 Tax=Alteribacillus iranensis TaxID=930128 RepID=A0A1I2CYG5_9BACI|nr:endospore germination permease [Alteribacillus iranensis]SFE73341.1 spore germination protein (amino acid permease) [Alteribacillus iranensis]